MEENEVIVLAKKDRRSRIRILISGINIFILALLVLILTLMFNREEAVWYTLLFLLGLGIGGFCIGYAIWDKKRPEAIITTDNNKEYINVYWKSEWKKILIKDIIEVKLKHNYINQRIYIMNPKINGSIIFETQKGQFRIYNVDDVTTAWYEIKTLVNEKKAING